MNALTRPATARHAAGGPVVTTSAVALSAVAPSGATRDAAGRQVLTRPVSAAGAVNQRNIIAYGLADGVRRWRATIPSRVGEYFVVANGTAYVPGEGALHAVDLAVGLDRWTLRAEGMTFSMPAVSDGLVHVVAQPPGRHSHQGRALCRDRLIGPPAETWARRCLGLLLNGRPIAVGRMVNKAEVARPGVVTALVRVYVVVMVATVVALVVLSAVAPRFATDEAWGHALIVAVLSVLLLVRERAARAGRPGAGRAVRIIAAVLLVMNAVEAALPGVFPVWMRIEMVAIALLMLAVLGAAVRSGSAAPVRG